MLAAEYLAGASGDFWKIAIRQPNAPSGQSIVYLELNGLTGTLLTTTYSGNLYGLPQEFFPSQLLSTLDRTDFSHGVPAVDAETAQSAASAAIERQYQRNMAEEGYTCFIESDFEDTAGGFSYYTGGGVVIFTKNAQNTSQGDIYWAALNWYGEVLDVGWNRNPLDAARFTLLMQGYLPPIYQRETVQQLQALLTGSLTDEAGLRQMEADGTLPLFNGLLALEVVPDASTKSTADDVTAAALKSLNAHLCYESSSFLVYREDGELIWHFWLSTDMGYRTQRDKGFVCGGFRADSELLRFKSTVILAARARLEHAGGKTARHHLLPRREHAARYRLRHVRQSYCSALC